MIFLKTFNSVFIVCTRKKWFHHTYLVKNNKHHQNKRIQDGNDSYNHIFPPKMFLLDTWLFSFGNICHYDSCIPADIVLMHHNTVHFWHHMDKQVEPGNKPHKKRVLRILYNVTHRTGTQMDSLWICVPVYILSCWNFRPYTVSF